MTIHEFSAGGIVFRMVQEKLEILLCQHSQHHGWVFPKGLIGDKIQGESKEATALREVKEETGIIGNIQETLTPISYVYTMEGVKRKKTVYYYLMNYVDGDISQHDWEMEHVEWIPYSSVLNRLTFASDKQVWLEVEQKLSSLQKMQ